jgi:hypothetical protein
LCFDGFKDGFSDSGAPVWPSSPPATNSYSPPATDSYYRFKRAANLTSEGVNGTRSKRAHGHREHHAHHGHHRGGRHFGHRHHHRGFGYGGYRGGYYGGYRGGYGRVDPFALGGGYGRDSYARSPVYETSTPTYASLDASLCAGKPDNYLHALGVCTRDYCICYQNKPYQQVSSIFFFVLFRRNPLVFQQCAEGEVFETQYSRCVRSAESPTCSPKYEPAQDNSACANEADGTLHALGVCSREFCICYHGKPYQQVR